MSVKFVTGDLFDPTHNFDALGHGVNCKGVMGAGIAVEFRKRWPGMYGRYRKMCAEGFLLPGMMMPFTPVTGPRIFNIASQDLPGANAHYEFLEAGLQYSLFFMQHTNIQTLGLPRIASDIGGLDFNKVVKVIEFVFGKADETVTIVSLGA